MTQAMVMTRMKACQTQCMKGVMMPTHLQSVSEGSCHGSTAQAAMHAQASPLYPLLSHTDKKGKRYKRLVKLLTGKEVGACGMSFLCMLRCVLLPGPYLMLCRCMALSHASATVSATA